ncbi:DNA polymerase kappa [Neolecta irregularis DAH-3]|uniref:DNA polymerase kappa n=1 Tax=Neolecta irregularis (strain DAH-3) TaxID=1198029 RepID=A0A1U7LR67_NEOID|nr:DNA polymerase kappa [Neolecta irregularis DAH-3]|eukprot:OLL25042.1 DNA polymerase kappa [Neolecta irregularis DAH-3]
MADEEGKKDDDASLRNRLGHTNKSGLDKVDRDVVNRVIYEASLGSKYFANEKRRDEELTCRINKMLVNLSDLRKLDLRLDQRKANEKLAYLEATRDLTQYIVHLDCDAFYASVEELDRPEFKTLPMAVGQGVLTTANYEARKYGCTAGMPAFIAMKLCPQLVCLPLKFDKYIGKANEIRAVLSKFDPDYQTASLDEAYLNITKYVNDHDMYPVDVVSQIRAEVLEATKLTISAGLAANYRLAKIASNQQKPNGQFVIPNERRSILDWMASMPVRKVNGIGKVFERELKAIGIETCGDIYEHRAYLCRLFGPKANDFLLDVYLGIGKTQHDTRDIRKSIGSERDGNQPGGGLSKNSIERSYHSSQAEKADTHMKSSPAREESAALPLLEGELPIKVRLMGLRLTQLSSQSRTLGTNPFFFKNLTRVSQGSNYEEPSRKKARTLTNSNIEDFQGLFQGLEGNEDQDLGEEELDYSVHAADDAIPECPICHKVVSFNDRKLNQHIDMCLNRDVVKKSVKDTMQSGEKPVDKQADKKSFFGGWTSADSNEGSSSFGIAHHPRLAYPVVMTQFSSTPENRTVPRTLFVPVRRRKPTSLSSLHSTVSKSSQDTTNDIYSSPATPVARQVLSEADDPGNWGIRLVDNTSSDQPGWARRVTVSHPEVIRGAGYLSEKNGYVVWKCCITMLEVR